MRTLSRVSHARRIAGARAKHNGEIFEQFFERRAYTQGFSITRMPDGCRQVGARKLLRVPTPFDWILSYYGKTALLDTKTIATDAFPNSLIKIHQVEEMMKHHANGLITGYVVHTRKNNAVFYVPTPLLLSVINTRGSISSSHPNCTALGTLQNLDLKTLFSSHS